MSAELGRLFQSTHSLRSATLPTILPSVCYTFQSTHSLLIFINEGWKGVNLG